MDNAREQKIIKGLPVTRKIGKQTNLTVHMMI